MIRPGISSFGYNNPITKPVMDLVTHLALVKDYPIGHPIGYGRNFKCT
jgi:alanine racemase